MEEVGKDFSHVEQITITSTICTTHKLSPSASQWFRCKKAQKDHATVSCLHRWQLVPTPVFTSDLHPDFRQKTGGRSTDLPSPGTTSRHSEDLPFAFERSQVDPSLEPPGRPNLSEAFLSDPKPTGPALAVGDRIRRIQHMAGLTEDAAEGEGVVQEIYVTDEQDGQVRLAPARGARTPEELARVERVVVKFRQRTRTLLPHQLDVLPTYIVKPCPVGFEGTDMWGGCVLRLPGDALHFPHEEDWTEVMSSEAVYPGGAAVTQPPPGVLFGQPDGIKTQMLLDVGQCKPSRQFLGAWVGGLHPIGGVAQNQAGKTDRLVPPVLLRRRTAADVRDAVEKGGLGVGGLILGKWTKYWGKDFV